MTGDPRYRCTRCAALICEPDAQHSAIGVWHWRQPAFGEPIRCGPLETLAGATMPTSASNRQ